MTYLLALDQGTTSTRAIVFDEALAVCGSAQVPLGQHFPAPGLVEHDAQEIWEGQRQVALAAIAAAGIAANAVAAIGITNQRETSVIWDRRSGQAIHHAIVWQDRRTAPLCERVRAEGHAALVQARTGLVIDPYFCASKIRWLLDHCEGARPLAEQGKLAFGTIDSWLIWNLTGGRSHVTDASNASRTLLYDIHKGDWDDELLALWNIPRALMPAVRDSSGVAAEVSALGELRCPIAGIAGDQQAALFGQACFDPGDAKCTYGTGCFILMNTGRSAPQSRAQLLTTVAWSIAGVREYALEGSVFMGGAVVQWLRDGLGLIARSADIESLAAQVTDSGGVVLVPAFTGLGAPYWDPDAGGLLIGLTRGTTKAHIARAALDGIALQVADVLDAMCRDSGGRLRELRVDGGASADDLLMQRQADLLQTPLIRPATLESTASGAAALAGLGIGVWPDRGAVAGLWSQARRFEPAMPEPELARIKARWQAAVARARHWHADAGVP